MLNFSRRRFLIFILSVFAASCISAFDFARFSFTILPTIPTDDGSLSNYGIGYHYTDRIASEIRLNITEKRTNEEFPGIDNSLNAVIHSEWKWFFIPLQYSFVRNEQANFTLGAGVYYYHEELEENGYFQLSSLETPVNAYINNFAMNLVGPMIEVDFSHISSGIFQITVNAGVVPYAYFDTQQKVNIIPLFASNYFSYSQSNFGAMFFYGKLTAGFFDLIDISGTYTGSLLTLGLVDFDADYNPFVSRKESYTQSIQIEGTVKIKFSSFNASIGIGGIFSSVYLDSVLATEGNRLYFVFGGKKTFM